LLWTWHWANNLINWAIISLDPLLILAPACGGRILDSLASWLYSLDLAYCWLGLEYSYWIYSPYLAIGRWNLASNNNLEIMTLSHAKNSWHNLGYFYPLYSPLPHPFNTGPLAPYLATLGRLSPSWPGYLPSPSWALTWTGLGSTSSSGSYHLG